MDQAAAGTQGGSPAGAGAAAAAAATESRNRIISVLLPTQHSQGTSISLTDLDVLIFEEQALVSAEPGLFTVLGWLRRIVVLRDEFHEHYPASEGLAYSDALRLITVLCPLVTNLVEDTKTELTNMGVLAEGATVSEGSYDFCEHAHEAIAAAVRAKREVMGGILAAERIAAAANRWVVLRSEGPASLRESLRLDEVGGMLVLPDLHCMEILDEARAEPFVAGVAPARMVWAADAEEEGGAEAEAEEAEAEEAEGEGGGGGAEGRKYMQWSKQRSEDVNGNKQASFTAYLQILTEDSTADNKKTTWERIAQQLRQNPCNAGIAVSVHSLRRKIPDLLDQWTVPCTSKPRCSS
ncbi:hypothetical protein B484DRAFT_390273 [Ochromonadaceae sp. CCMP2298]|nr:hypothetical protein B484DRAFT_390273 [Ochromonadaceae sp. CCMP2298]